MKTIWKFPLELTDRQTIKMPIDAQILSVQSQGNVICLWAIVDECDGNRLVPRTFFIAGTGNPLPCNPKSMAFIGTVQIVPFVWHVFESQVQHG